jgi:GDPmannose 4,6-dehydratase
MHAMLQHPVPKNYVVGTGASHSVRDFLQQVLVELKELGYGESAPKSIEQWVGIDPQFLRPGEIHDLQADATLARNELGWQPTVDFEGLVRMMVEADLAWARERHAASTPQATSRRA